MKAGDIREDNEMIENPNKNKLKAYLLHKLRRVGCWKEPFIPLSTLLKFIPSRLTEDTKKVIDEMVIENSFLLPHKRGKSFSLNARKKEEIIQFIRKNKRHM